MNDMHELLDALEDISYSVTEAATLLTIEPKQVKRLIKTGALAARIFKGALLISSDDLHVYQRGLEPGTRYEVLDSNDTMIPRKFNTSRE